MKRTLITLCGFLLAAPGVYAADAAKTGISDHAILDGQIRYIGNVNASFIHMVNIEILQDDR